jgi:hypothetical protein
LYSLEAKAVKCSYGEALYKEWRCESEISDACCVPDGLGGCKEEAEAEPRTMTPGPQFHRYMVVLANQRSWFMRQEPINEK